MVVLIQPQTEEQLSVGAVPCNGIGSARGEKVTSALAAVLDGVFQGALKEKLPVRAITQVMFIPISGFLRWKRTHRMGEA